MATIKVNLSAVGKPCDQDATPGGKFPGPGWYVFLMDCNGNVVERAGKQYGPYAVDHGYVEIKDVPHGRYWILAMVNPFPVSAPIPGGEIIFQSNFVSHFAIVDVCCGCHDYCVTLYNSGWHYCFRVILHWIQLLMAQKQMPLEVGRNAVNALNAALKSGTTVATDEAVLAAIDRVAGQFGAQ